MNKKTIFQITLFLSVTCLVLFSCKDKASNSVEVEDSSFLFKLIVKDITGRPVTGLRISTWDVLSTDYQLNFKGNNTSDRITKTNKVSATSMIEFLLAAKSFVTLTVRDLRTSGIQKLEERTMNIGSYNYTWSIPFGTPSGVYKIRLDAKNDTINFQDSIYAVFHNMDPNQNIIGYTGNEGIFESTNTNLFPSTLDLPVFKRTNSTGPETIGTFNYTDSIAIVLTDTSYKQQQKYYSIITKNKNIINLIWSPGNNLYKNNKNEYPHIENKFTSPADSGISVVTPTKCMLMQNYPNPFN